MRTSNVALLAEIDILELRIGIDANELEVVKEIDRMTDEISFLSETKARLIKVGHDTNKELRREIDLQSVEIAELREMVKLYKLSSDEVTKYKHVLSYNESYAGEPEGEIKNNLAELDMVSCKAIQLLAKHK